jgi:hypothetical protein
MEKTAPEARVSGMNKSSHLLGLGTAGLQTEGRGRTAKIVGDFVRGILDVGESRMAHTGAIGATNFCGWNRVGQIKTRLERMISCRYLSPFNTLAQHTHDSTKDDIPQPTAPSN